MMDTDFVNVFHIYSPTSHINNFHINKILVSLHKKANYLQFLNIN